ncbi:unnamed protein product, partial [Symbiodinium microadriaticum]
PEITQSKYWGFSSNEVAAVDTVRCLDALELLLRTQTSPAETAAIVLEPVLGEGGYVPSPPGFLRGVQKICREHGILLVADEVQTGFGRTGSMFAVDWLDDGAVHPDILIMAKGIANGFPLSAIATRSDLSDHQPPGSMGGTYGANSVCCAAACAVLDVFKEEDILSHVLAGEVLIRQRLQQLMQDTDGSAIAEVRGRGLMLGVEFNRPAGKITGWMAKEVSQECLTRGLLVLSCGPYDTVRLIPALNASVDDINKGMDIFSAAVATVAASCPIDVGA